AHFISHVLGYKFGLTCGDMQKGTGATASIRVFQVFQKCPKVGKWESRPSSLEKCLVFITHAGNVHLAAHKMDNVPKKHLGIFCDSKVWHYSNSQQRVVNQTPEEFKKHYPAPDNSLFYGELPSP